MMVPFQQPFPARPRPVWVVTAVVALEAFALVLLGLRFTVSLFSAHTLPAGGILFGAVVMWAGALWLGAAARGTWRGSRWPRAAILVSQVFLVIVGLSLMRAGGPGVGIGCALAAGVTLVCLFMSTTVEWMHRTARN